MLWTTDQPIVLLPERIRRCYSKEADYLYQELDRNHLEVVLIPAPEPRHSGHMVRCAINQNPSWYRKLYWSRGHLRRDRSLNALDRLRRQKDKSFRIAPFKYDAIYRTLIHARLIGGYTSLDTSVEPNELVREFFGLESIV